MPKNQSPTRSETRSQPKRRHLWKWVVAATIPLVVVAFLLLNNNEDTTQTVTIYGTDYTTTQTVEGHNGYVYVSIPVNTDTSTVIVEVENGADNLKIREFLDQLDTFIPGEHVIALSDGNLHFIVDGIEN